MARREGKDKMRTLFRGSDKGNAMLLSLSLIIIFSLIFLTVVPYISGLKRTAAVYKEDVLYKIRRSNMDIVKTYDLH